VAEAAGLREARPGVRLSTAERAAATVGRPDQARRSYLIHRMLLGSDLLALLLAYGLMLGANALDSRPVFDAENLAAFVVTIPVWVIAASIVGLYHLYERRVDHTFADELVPVFMVTTVWAWFLLGIDSGLDEQETQLYGVAVLWASAITTVLCTRALARHLATRRSWFRQPVMLIGARRDAERVLARIRRHPECGLEPVLALRLDRGRATLRSLDGDDDLDAETPRFAAGWGADPERTAAWIRHLGIDRVIIAGRSPGLGEHGEVVRALASHGITVDEVAAEPEALLSTAVLHHLEGLPVLTIRPSPITKGAVIVKRTLDVWVACAGLAVLSPLLAYISVRVKLDSPGPVLFKQRRAGLHGKPFELLKFRTMVDGAEAMQEELLPRTLGNGGGTLFKLRDDPRVTRFGARLRRWSLDEIPQLWNVLRGDMSLVGPRPLPLDEAALVDGHHAERTRVRPGMTGPWQVHGRSDIPFEQMLQLDYTYVAAWTMREDLRLLARTVSAVLRRQGAY
jgi:exopolysaccharide biosynthesis polyprenyl glycosylphosphotransferase